MSTIAPISTQSKHLFDEAYRNIKSDVKNKIIASYFGDLSQGMSYTLSNKIETLLEAENDKKSVLKKVFNVIIEGLQNVRLHGAVRNEEKIASIILSQNENDYLIQISSLIQTKDKDNLQHIIDDLNSLDQDVLKKRYLSIMSEGSISESGGAGLGLITIRLKSKNKIDYRFHDFDKDTILYELKATVAR